jgi:hypothetical protein
VYTLIIYLEDAQETGIDKYENEASCPCQKHIDTSVLKNLYSVNASFVLIMSHCCVRECSKTFTNENSSRDNWPGFRVYRYQSPVRLPEM